MPFEKPSLASRCAYPYREDGSCSIQLSLRGRFGCAVSAGKDLQMLGWMQFCLIELPKDVNIQFYSALKFERFDC